MSNFFADILGVERFIVGIQQKLLGGSWFRSTRPTSGSSGIAPGIAAPLRPGMRPPQGRPGARPGVPGAPQRPGAPAAGGAPQRPGAPMAPGAPAGPVRPGPAAPGMPGIPPADPNRPRSQTPQGVELFGYNMHNLPQIPGVNTPTGKMSPAQDAAAQQAQLIKARGLNLASMHFHATLSQWYTSARSFFERRA